MDNLISSLLPLLLCSCLVIAAAATLATLWLCLCYYYNCSSTPGPLDFFSSRLYQGEEQERKSFANSLRKKRIWLETKYSFPFSRKDVKHHGQSIIMIFNKAGKVELLYLNFKQFFSAIWINFYGYHFSDKLSFFSY